MKDNPVEHVYYIATEDKLSIVPTHTHESFCHWLISKHSYKVGDFYFDYKTLEEITSDFLQNFENNEIVYLGEL